MPNQRLLNHDIKAEYESALEMVRYHGMLLWQIFQAFILAITVLSGFIFQKITPKFIGVSNLQLFVGSLVGFLISILWLATFKRNSDYYNFRIAQAKEIESRLNYRILQDGEDFSEGYKVKIQNKPYKIGILGAILRTSIATPILISIFIVIYLFFMLVSGPWY